MHRALGMIRVIGMQNNKTQRSSLPVMGILESYDFGYHYGILQRETMVWLIDTTFETS